MNRRIQLMRIARTGALTTALLLPVLGTSSFGATQVIGELAQPASVRVSGEPGGLAVDALTARAYAADTAENVLVVVDLNSGQPVAYVPTGLRPGQVVLGPKAAYVSNFGDHSITVVDVATNTPRATVSAGGLGLALDALRNRLFAAEGSRIAVLDASTFKLQASIAAPAGANLWGLALDSVNDRLYATDIASARLLAFDVASGALVREIALPGPARLAVTYSGGRVFVATYTARDSLMLAIDTQTTAIIARRPAAAFTGALIVDGAGTLYSASAAERVVRSADTGAAATLADAKIADAIGGIALDPRTNQPLVVTRGGAAPPVRTLPQQAPVVRP